LKKWRKEKGISQKKLAERCKAAHSYIRQIESGKGHTSFAFIEKLALALNIEPFQLFYDETKIKPEKLEQSEKIESIKSTFLERMSNEFDTIIERLKPHQVP
jgi:transcriptional regulator with XRE-family HTH domain